MRNLTFTPLCKCPLTLCSKVLLLVRQTLPPMTLVHNLGGARLNVSRMVVLTPETDPLK